MSIQHLASWASRRYSQASATTFLWLLPPFFLALLILPFVGWGFTDDDIFILHYLVGKPYRPPIWPAIGRFFPLGHQEWRFISGAQEASTYHAVAMLQYFIFCWAIWKTLQLLNIAIASALFFVVTLPSIIIAFSNIIVPERTQTMLAALWLLTYILWDQKRAPRAGLLALIFANATMYYKEPTFLFFLGFSTVQQLRHFAPNHGIARLVSDRWLDTSIFISSFLFVSLYFYNVSFDTLTTGRAYQGHSIRFDHLAPFVVKWAFTEPLLIPILLAGASLSLIQYWKGRALLITTSGLFVGSFLYLSVLVLSGLASKYFAALPFLGLGLHFLAELHRVMPPRVLNALLSFLAIASTAFWAPSIAYKHDWTYRNKELVDQILDRKSSGGDVAIDGADGWDAYMLVLYANRVRHADLHFYCSTPNLGADTTWQIWCPTDKFAAAETRIVLGKSAAELTINKKLEWSYTSKWRVLVPARIQQALERHYNFW